VKSIQKTPEPDEFSQWKQDKPNKYQSKEALAKPQKQTPGFTWGYSHSTPTGLIF